MAKPRGKLNRAIRRYLRWPLEAAGFYLGLGLIALLPVDAASNLGGWLLRTVGPRTGLSRRAYRNLRVAFPDKEQAELDRIVAGMWDNLGRTAAEYAHLKTISDPNSGRVELLGMEHVQPCIEGRKPAILVSAHFANWEVLHLMTAPLFEKCTTIVRETNNPYVQRLLEKRRGVRGGQRVPKGTTGARASLDTLKHNGFVAMLVDQRMSEGISVPFFGHPAMSPSAASQMALRFDALLLPTRLERTGPARFRLTFTEPLPLPREGSRNDRVVRMTTELNRILEGWIRERPEQWLWLHRRWSKDIYRDLGL